MHYWPTREFCCRTNGPCGAPTIRGAFCFPRCIPEHAKASVLCGGVPTKIKKATAATDPHEAKPEGERSGNKTGSTSGAKPGNRSLPTGNQTYWPFFTPDRRRLWPACCF